MRGYRVETNDYQTAFLHRRTGGVALLVPGLDRRRRTGSGRTRQGWSRRKRGDFKLDFNRAEVLPAHEIPLRCTHAAPEATRNVVGQ